MCTLTRRLTLAGIVITVIQRPQDVCADNINIAVLMPNLIYEFFKHMLMQMKDEASQCGSAQIIEPDSLQPAPKQVVLITDIIERHVRGVSGIIIYPDDVNILAPVMQ